MLSFWYILLPKKLFPLFINLKPFWGRWIICPSLSCPAPSLSSPSLVSLAALYATRTWRLRNILPSVCVNAYVSVYERVELYAYLCTEPSNLCFASKTENSLQLPSWTDSINCFKHYVPPAPQQIRLNAYKLQVKTRATLKISWCGVKKNELWAPI